MTALPDTPSPPEAIRIREEIFSQLPGGLRCRKKEQLKSYGELRTLYRAINPEKTVIVYCHSGRRASFTYFVLRLLGFNDVILYDHSRNGWGNWKSPYPIETGTAHPKTTTPHGIRPAGGCK
ncbi:MAG: hypothetical protein HY742_03370 [Deltaproteobacteria bacterium]|nr:hypothetical protein [Deltaproteobacteria bacterium]